MVLATIQIFSPNTTMSVPRIPHNKCLFPEQELSWRTGDALGLVRGREYVGSNPTESMLLLLLFSLRFLPTFVQSNGISILPHIFILDLSTFDNNETKNEFRAQRKRRRSPGT